MNIKEEKKEVVLDQVRMISQMKEAGREIETIDVIAYVKEVIDPSISDQFYLQVMISEGEKINSIAGVYSVSDILENGTIILGRLYMIGPVNLDNVRYEASIHYITE